MRPWNCVKWRYGERRDLNACFDNPVSARCGGMRKLGTVDCDLVETTPIVFRERLYRCEYIRSQTGPTTRGYHGNDTADSYFRLLDVEANSPGPAFGVGLHLGSAYADDHAVYAFGTHAWGGPTIHGLRSEDMETWQSEPVLNLPGWAIYNTSVCRADDRYVMAIEIDKPLERAGVPYTIVFAESSDLHAWRLLPEACDFSRERYTACPTLRRLGEWFYMTYLESRPGPAYEQWVVRSRDLRHWEASPRNPILCPSDGDKRIASPNLTVQQQARIREALDINNSDMDLCEFEKHTVITYSWGDQNGNEFLAQAEFPGTMRSLMEGFFTQDAGGAFGAGDCGRTGGFR